VLEKGCTTRNALKLVPVRREGGIRSESERQFRIGKKPHTPRSFVRVANKWGIAGYGTGSVYGEMEEDTTLEHWVNYKRVSPSHVVISVDSKGFFKLLRMNTCGSVDSKWFEGLGVIK